ncbi:hypothetical protein B0H13DRAFT_2372408 [Mycena leptocephala]|nr:hypothetical protein B0H13DRAFT_2372408 [Mycena leptocephala]
MTSLILQYSAASLLFCATALAVTPIVASTTSYGSLVNAGLNRDSCTSSFWTTNVVLWVCRDSQSLSASGVPQDPSVANTASFSPLPSDPSNPQPLVLSSPQGFGSPYYSLEPDECPPLGLCGDGTRWVGWPDTGPVVTFRGTNGVVNAYAFISRQHLSGLSVLNTPSYSSFWSSTQIGYGSAASVVNNGFAYLYGATPDRKLAVARAALTGFLGSLEDKGIYEYYVNNFSHRAAAWTTTAPTASDPGVPLPNTSSIQGTIYWSPKWEVIIRLDRGDTFPDANFYISTAPNPEGPWTAAQQACIPIPVPAPELTDDAAILQRLTDGTGDYIFIVRIFAAFPIADGLTTITQTWTKTRPSANGDMYDAPLIRVDWQ